MAPEPYRILVVEDDVDVALYVRVVLERAGDMAVEVHHHGRDVVDHVRRLQPHVIVTDLELPGVHGLEIVHAVREVEPELPIVVMTAHASVDYAVRALRDGVSEFLQKPLDSAALVDVVRRLAIAHEEQRTRSRRSILAVGAHPDDVEIGVGGTLAAHAAAGDAITVLTLSRGARGGVADERQHEALASAELIGARLFLEDLVDTHIPATDPTVGIIERVVAASQPDVVYTHSSHDRHQDHRAVHEATLIATRGVAEVACYQSPSSTIDFRPSRFVTIDEHVDAKLALLECFASQGSIRDYLDPDFVVATARYWSRFGTGRACEPLEIVRDAGGVQSVARAAHRASRTRQEPA
ncbi:hypothetical protein GCM10009846_16150 [Agrococcus versicolor]|uniref:Response regulatory domain-containing protein n=1 Tax=Agrococcus versicolor TaxID=501482 RepID=A0ABP5MKK0_9MICO